MASLPREAFLSHASDDGEVAERLARVLAAHSIPTWRSQHDNVGAQQWHDEIGTALLRCDWFLLLLSPSAVRSKWVKREFLFALQDERYEDHILPILVRPCDINAMSWTLAQFQTVDFTADFLAGCEALLRVWSVARRPGIDL